MRPEVYFDIELRGSDLTGVSPLVARSEAFMHLHAAFVQMPSTFALAIPRGRLDRLRIFATERSDHDRLAEKVGQHRWFRDYARLDYPKSVPIDYAGPRVAFVRWRIPTVASDRHAVDGVSALRDRRLASARERRLDHFQTHSRSTGARFSLTIERLSGNVLSGEGDTNSYGLSSRQAPLGLPDLP